MSADSPSTGEPAQRDGKPTALDSEFLRRIAAGDQQASAAFLALVHDRACQLVEDALTGPPQRRSAVVERLIRAYCRDDLQIQAALLSAQTSFRRYLLDLTQSGDIRDDRDYVSALISLAYNRWQRQHYSTKKTQRQMAAAAPRNGDDDQAPARLTQVADSRPGPDHKTTIEDFYEKLLEEIHLMSAGLKPGEADVVYLRLFQELTYEQISGEVGKSIASVHRICQQVVAHLRQRFRDSAP